MESIPAISRIDLILKSGFPVAQWLKKKKNPLANTRDAGDVGSDPWVEKIPWNRKWKITPVFFLENPMNRGAWWVTAHGFRRVRHN